MNYPTVYARITPTNGVSGDKYSVSVTGVTATVDTQKTWSSGSLIFAITPSALGTMVVTFKNDTTGTVIGTKSIVVKEGSIYGANQLGIIWANAYEGEDEETSWVVYGIYTNQLNGGWVSGTRLTLPNGCVCDFFSINTSSRNNYAHFWLELTYVSGTKPTAVNLNIEGIGTVNLPKNNINTSATRLVFSANYPTGSNRIKLSGTLDKITITT